MEERYFYIEPWVARGLLAQSKKMKPAKHGIDSRVYLIGEYAVLSTSRIKLRNVATRDDDLAYFDELIETLMRLREQGVAAVPILGYCYDSDSADGTGYIFQPRAKGEELYDDEVMKHFKVWLRKRRNPFQRGRAVEYLLARTKAVEYLLARTKYVSEIPQEHFDKFIGDIIILNDNDVLIDFIGKSNFFYDASAGFQFIDLDSHTDYKYGLAEKYDSRELACVGGFAPCHFAADTTAFSRIALDEKALARLGKDELQQLARDNGIIFEKCKTAMLNNGCSREQLEDSLKLLKIFGV